MLLTSAERCITMEDAYFPDKFCFKFAFIGGLNDHLLQIQINVFVYFATATNTREN
jgi:hypothetical protein